tara:strand:+ start:704 stop:1429 length:726 start_codon:yes stop_codon:yes gene_type:complete
MAGKGSRFSKAGYLLPKPLIEIHGHPMIKYVIHNLRPKQQHRFIFLCLRDHIERYKVDKLLQTWEPTCEIVIVEDITEGAACTVLFAKNLINNSQGLMIANSDQWVDVNIDMYLCTIELAKLDGLIMTMWANDPKWSYVRLNEKKEIVEVVEKKVVSNEATVGIYNFARGFDFVKAAERMIKKELRVNGEYYVAPAYNELLNLNKNIGYYNVGKEDNGMYGLGIPADLKKFRNSPISHVFS